MDRRRTPRRAPQAGEPLSRVRLRTGRDLSVVDASNTGLLVEGAARLLPGTHVDVHVVTRDGRVLVRSRVVRAYVSNLTAELVGYRAALAFDRPVDTSASGYAIPPPSLAATLPSGTSYPTIVPDAAPQYDQRASA